MKDNDKRKSHLLLLGFAYIGAVIGAGFASGQEILQFFTVHGNMGIFGFALSSALFALFGGSLIEFGRRLKADSHTQVLAMIGGNAVGRLLDAIVLIYLFGSLIAMAAGAGAVGEEIAGLPQAYGSLLLLIASAVTVALGLDAVLTTLGAVAPIMIISVLGVCAATFWSVRGCIVPVAESVPPAIDSLWISTCLYVSYNMLGAIPVLAPMGRNLRRKRESFFVAVIGAAGLGIGALSAHMAMTAVPEAMHRSVPMMFLANRLNFGFGKLYALIILAEVFTTAVASMYGLMGRFDKRAGFAGKKGRTGFWVALATMVMGSWVLSRLGLAGVVRTIYPAMGFAGILLLAALVLRVPKLFRLRV